MHILSKIPFFIWPLLAVLLIGGLKARKTSIMPLFLLLLFPSVFFVWSFTTLVLKYSLLALVPWFFCLGIGFFTGFSHIQRLKLRFDKQKAKVEMPGSWIPLILSMSIFSAKFTVGMLTSIFPELSGSIAMLSLELFAAFILGIFLGRGICCLLKYRAASEGFLIDS